MNFFIKSENPNRKLCWDENLFFLPGAFPYEIGIDGKITFVTLLCDLAVFDGGGDGAIGSGCAGAAQ